MSRRTMAGHDVTQGRRRGVQIDGQRRQQRPAPRSLKRSSNIGARCQRGSATSAPMFWGVIAACLIGLSGLYMVADWWFSQASDPMDRVLIGEVNTQEGEAYRAANRQRPGVVEYPSGLQVEVLEMGEGERPLASDLVRLDFRSWHVDGRLIEDTWRLGTPAVVPVERTIPGWREVLLGMPVGSHVKIVVPPELAYGPAGSGRIGPRETLIFELALHAIEAPIETDPATLGADQDRVPGLR